MNVDMKNYSNTLIEKAIASMEQNEWEWPSGWNKTQRKTFTEHLMTWLEEREMYEQCQIVENYVKPRLEEK